MKKSILSILFFLFIQISFVKSQVVFDVDTLFQLFEVSGNKELEIGDENNQIPLRVLARYASIDESITEITPQEIIDDYYQDNPFIGPNGIMKLTKTQNGNFIFSKNKTNNNSGISPVTGVAMPSAPGGMIFDNFAKGLTLFIVERFKQELSATFFRDFKKKLEKHEDLEMIFPQTTITLGAIDSDIYQFNTYINELRNAFVKDMQSFPSHAESYLINKEQFLNEFPELKFALADAFHLTDMLLEDNVDLPRAFEYLGKDAYIQGDLISDNKRVNDVKATLAFANEFLQSIRSEEYGKIFIHRNQLKDILRYDNALIIYCGLEFQRIKHIEFGNGQTAAQFFNPDDRMKVANSLRQAIAFGDNINEYKEELELAIGNDSLRTEIQYKIFTSIFDMLETQFNLVEELAKFEAENQEILDNYVTLISVLGEMGFDLKRENYSSAMVNLSKAITLLPFDDNADVAKVIMKYGSFAAEVSEAQSPEQAKEVIERYAMPVGGSSKKKRSRFDMSINAYMGLGGGSETLYTDSTSHTASYIAVSAPVGIAVSTGFGKGGSVSLFFPIIDVGALASYRLNDNDFSNLPKLTFNNVFSPGGYIIYGMGNDIPISLGLGAQMGPNLREVTNDTKFDVTEARGFRFGAFIAVDIPIFSVYNRGR